MDIIEDALKNKINELEKSFRLFYGIEKHHELWESKVKCITEICKRIYSMDENDLVIPAELVNEDDLKLHSTISSAYRAILKMDSFDMTSDFKKHFDEQKRIISQMYNRSNPFMHSAGNKSSTSSGSGCMVMLCAIFGLVVLTIYGLINM